MRIQTKEQRAQYRQIMIPKGAVKDTRSTDAGEVYAYEMAGKFYGIAFRGTAGKPEFHYSYRTAEQREAKAVEFFASVAYSQERKATERAAVKAFKHDVKPGDIFRASWGYDQTNIDYYQCVALIGSHMMEVREIGSQSEDTQYMQGNCVPVPGLWETEADYSEAGHAHKAQHGHYPRKEKASMRVKIQGAGNEEPCFRVESYCCAYREKPVAVVAGTPIFKESHWTAYA